MRPAPAPDDVASRPTLHGGRYALFGKIAEGGTAAIFRAWDTKLRRWRAVKVLLPEFSQRRRLRARFESEARAMAAIDHPNVTRVLDVVTEATLPYLVMEFADGGSLAEWIEQHGAMPPRLALQCVAQIARGLGAAHDVGVIHRDVKPQNVLLDRSGRCMVSDFGIAHVEFLDSMTRTGTSMGTIGYMAPEQRNDARAVDARADVYALAALLYKLLTSVVLTDMFMIGRDAELIAPIPPALRPMLAKACAHDRDARYPDVASFAADLAAVEGLLPEDPPGTPPLASPDHEAPLDASPRAFTAIASVLAAPSSAEGGGGASAGSEPVSTAEVRLASGSLEPLPSAEARAVVVTVRRRAPVARVGGALVLGAALLALAAFSFSLWTIRLAQRREIAARSALYGALTTDPPILDAVGARSLEPSTLAQLLAQQASFETTNREPARQQAADLFVTALLAETAPAVAAGVPTTVEVQLRNLAVTHATWQAAHHDLATTRTTLPGVWAATLGF